MSSMSSTSAADGSRSAVVGRLRAAGCVFAEDEARLLFAQARTSAELADMVERRVAGLPLEHILGWAEFCGLRIAVEPGVFVPRRRSELLVRQALLGIGRGDRRRVPGRPVVVDLCCGSGAVGAALFALDAASPGGPDRIEVYAVDIDPAAVRCARRNLAAAGGHVHQGDLYAPLPAAIRGRVEVLVANAPYVPTGEIDLLPAEARLHEPRTALDGGADGLDVLRRVIAAAPGWLAPGGRLLVEASERQAPRIVDAVAGSGLRPHIARSGELNATAVVGVRPAEQDRSGPGAGCGC